MTDRPSANSGQRSANASDRPYLIFFVLGVCSLIVIRVISRGYIWGDACIYADNILSGRFDDISIHIGYYCLGWLAHQTTGIFSASIDMSLILLSNATGALSVAFLYLIVKRLSDDSALAVTAALLMLFSGAFLEYARYAEVYAPQTALLLGSFLALVHRQDILAGVCLSLAMLITPLTVFVSTPLILLLCWQRAGVRRWLTVGIVSLLVYLPVFFVLHDEMLWGRRGLLTISSAMEYNTLREVVVNIAYSVVKSWTFMSALVLAGAGVVLAKHRSAFWGLGLLAAAVCYPMLKMNRFDVETLVLPLFAVLAVLAAIALLTTVRWIISRNAIRVFLLALVLATFAASTLLVWIPASDVHSPLQVQNRAWPSGMQELAADIGKDGLLVTSFWNGVSYVFYTREDLQEPLEVTEGNARWIDIESMNTWKLSPLYGKEPVLVLESYSPSPISMLLLDHDQLAQRRTDNSVVARLQSLNSRLDLDSVLTVGQFPAFRILRGAKDVQ